MYNNKLELKVRRQRIRIKSRRLSSHKIFVSKGEFKHTNDRVMINIYIYNRQKYNYFYKLKKIYEKLLRKNLLFKRISRAIKKSYFLINIIKKIYNKNIELNIINLKYFYLNSDIYTEYVTNKITKNRKKLYKILKYSVRKVKILNHIYQFELKKRILLINYYIKYFLNIK